jgi:hypothetical protein
MWVVEIKYILHRSASIYVFYVGVLVVWVGKTFAILLSLYVMGKRESFVLCLFISDVHSATGKPLYGDVRRVH